MDPVTIGLSLAFQCAPGIIKFSSNSNSNSNSNSWMEQVFSFSFGTRRSNKQKNDTIPKLTGQ